MLQPWFKSHLNIKYEGKNKPSYYVHMYAKYAPISIGLLNILQKYFLD